MKSVSTPLIVLAALALLFVLERLFPLRKNARVLIVRLLAARYLRPEKLVPINQTFKTLAQQATAGKKDDRRLSEPFYSRRMTQKRS